ncbi:MAG: response regulator transcription factor [Chthoniobacterales bacterium]
MPKSKKIQVVVADAEPMARLGVRHLLEAHDRLEVCAEAACARSARDLCAKWQPGLLVLDAVLADGFTLIQDLPQWSAATRVVVFTGQADATTVQRALQAGALGYVTRLDPVSALLGAMLEAAEGRRMVGPQVESLLLENLASGGVELRSNGVESLTRRELEIFRLIGGGAATKTVAAELRVSVKTVESYRGKIKDKLGLRTGHELQRQAMYYVTGGKLREG